MESHAVHRLDRPHDASALKYLQFLYMGVESGCRGMSESSCNCPSNVNDSIYVQ